MVSRAPQRVMSAAFVTMPPVLRHTRAAARWSASATSSPVRSQAPAATSSFRLAPSDFAFLWEECHRCFYLKAHKKLFRPRPPFPSIFGSIDLSMKRHFRGLPTAEIVPAMKPGTFLCEDDDAWVECMPITPPGHTSSVYIRGMVDCLVRFEDGTFGIVDFKTSNVGKSSEIYSRQLHAYARAIEDPASGSELIQGTVSDMSLVVYTPNAFHTPTVDGGGFGAALTGDLTYVNMPRDDAGFDVFLSEVLDVLTLPAAPPSPPPSKARWSGSFSSCPYCQFLHDAKEKGFIPGHVDE